MRRQGGEEVELLLILALGSSWGGQRHASAALNPREKAPGTRWIGSWVSIRADMDSASRRIICICGVSNPGRPVCSHKLHWLSYPSSCFMSSTNILYRE
jgi:hypothetical protein